MSVVDVVVVVGVSLVASGLMGWLKRRPSTRYRVYAHRCGVCGRWHSGR